MESPQPPPLPKRRTRRWAWVLILFLSIGLFVSVMMNVGLGIRALAGSSGWSAHDDVPVDEFPQFDEEWSYGHGETKVVRLALSGMIFRDVETGWLGGTYDMVGDLLAQIQAATQDDSVRAILLEVDSPGGAVTPTDEIYRALNSFRESSEGRVVVTHIRDMAASGGYYAAMASDWIVADPTAIVGSIGIIMQTLNWQGLSERLGISDVTIKSGDNKDMLNPFRETKPEELALLQEVVDNLHQRFVGIVGDARGLDPDTLDRLADGRILTADRAVEEGLIDAIGSWREAADKIAILLGENDLRLIRYYTSYGFFDRLFSVRAPQPANMLGQITRPRFLYLWSP